MRTTIIFDPLGKAAPGIGPGDILDACGLLPQWVTDPALMKYPLREALEAAYDQGPLTPLEGVSLYPNMELLCPGDPPLIPMLIIERRPSETFIQYPYALVCLRTTEGDFFTRMD